MATVRRVAPGDGPAVREIRLQALRSDPGAFGSTYERELERPDEVWLQRATAASSGYEQCLFVAKDGTGLVGMVGAYTPIDDSSRRHLYGMWVAPHVRRQGLAAALVEAVKDWAMAAGATRLDLWVNDVNQPALTLYRQAGFTDTGISQPLPSDPSFTERLLSNRLG